MPTTGSTQTSYTYNFGPGVTIAQVIACGAGGVGWGGGTTYGGNGCIVSAYFDVDSSKSYKLNIIVGSTAVFTFPSGGGYYSSVVDASNNILVVAGGGGGSASFARLTVVQNGASGGNAGNIGDKGKSGDGADSGGYGGNTNGNGNGGAGATNGSNWLSGGGGGAGGAVGRVYGGNGGGGYGGGGGGGGLGVGSGGGGGGSIAIGNSTIPINSVYKVTYTNNQTSGPGLGGGNINYVGNPGFVTINTYSKGNPYTTIV